MMNHVLSRAVIGVFAFLVPGAAAIAAEKAPEQRSFDPAATSTSPASLNLASSSSCSSRKSLPKRNR